MIRLVTFLSVVAISLTAYSATGDTVGGALLYDDHKMSLSLECVERNANSQCVRAILETNACQIAKENIPYNSVMPGSAMSDICRRASGVDGARVSLDLSSYNLDIIVHRANEYKKLYLRHDYLALGFVTSMYACVLGSTAFSNPDNLRRSSVGVSCALPGAAGFIVDIAKSPFVALAYGVQRTLMKSDFDKKIEFLFSDQNKGKVMNVDVNELRIIMQALAPQEEDLVK